MINSMPNADEIMIESLIAIKRSGATNIICYSAEKIAEKINKI
jgi:delta-aminolevulinic acid dehydratase/porphobilinogen synthase